MRRAHIALNRNHVNSYVWKPSLKAANVPATRENGFPALRHHFASSLLRHGVDIRALADYLGHSDLGFTLRICAPHAGCRRPDARDG
jgi:site-specific recombinase XerD